MVRNNPLLFSFSPSETLG